MNLRLNQRDRIVYADGEALHLTKSECGILSVLMAHPDCVVSSEQIYREVFAQEPYACRGTIYVHVRHLRAKIEQDPDCPQHILMAWGKGYLYHP
ncbi:winged helix-turn-helix domain-containing protein [Anaerolactibacter massiliensis]|uniref:winged helix-turn-helix domain-containing protein n=1 Tax=Anaerolactibacter massiliensis TaxID=2044573 RepID=UPI000CF9D031|nr:winged helix-turn-helix domain-containing protein [Anaerolactibacter massiliensis]